MLILEISSMTPTVSTWQKRRTWNFCLVKCERIRRKLDKQQARWHWSFNWSKQRWCCQEKRSAPNIVRNCLRKPSRASCRGLEYHLQMYVSGIWKWTIGNKLCSLCCDGQEEICHVPPQEPVELTGKTNVYWDSKKFLVAKYPYWIWKYTAINYDNLLIIWQVL